MDVEILKTTTLEWGALWVTFRKDILTEAYLLSLGLNEQQIRAVEYVKKRGEITNREYQELNHISKPSATRDLADMVVKRILFVSGKGKRSIPYVLNEPKMSQMSQMSQIGNE